MSNGYRSVLASGGGVTPTGDAVVSDVLAGKTFSNANNVGLEGTMPNIGAVDQTIQPGGSYTVPAGYHNGNGRVRASNPTVTITRKATNATSATTFTCAVGDIICIGANDQKSVTGATFVELISSDTQYGEYRYVATATSVTVPATSSAHARWIDLIHIG